MSYFAGDFILHKLWDVQHVSRGLICWLLAWTLYLSANRVAKTSPSRLTLYSNLVSFFLCCLSPHLLNGHPVVGRTCWGGQRWQSWWTCSWRTLPGRRHGLPASCPHQHLKPHAEKGLPPPGSTSSRTWTTPSAPLAWSLKYATDSSVKHYTNTHTHPYINAHSHACYCIRS